MAPKADAPSTTVQVADGREVVAAIVGLAVDTAALVVMEGACVVVLVVMTPLVGRTLMSAQFQNCSPQPECPFGPAGPEQEPAPTVHQGDRELTQ